MMLYWKKGCVRLRMIIPLFVIVSGFSGKVRLHVFNKLYNFFKQVIGRFNIKNI